MIYAVLGDRGAGKTTIMTFTAYKEYMEQGRKIVCNYKLNFPPSPTGGEVINMSLAEVVELPDEIDGALLLLDEFHLIVNSRKIFSKSNEKYIRLVTQLRKRKIDFFFATQRLRMVDVQIRDQVNFLMISEPLGNNKFRIILIDKWTEEILNTYDFDATKFFKANLFDTDEIIDTGQKELDKKREEENENENKPIKRGQKKIENTGKK